MQQKEKHWHWKGGRPKCIDCGKQLWDYGLKRCKKCSSKFYSGSNHWSWKGGKPYCPICGKKLCSYKHKFCIKCLGKQQRGKSNPAWKGGITSFGMIIRGSTKFEKWRKKVFKKDNYTCWVCKKRGGNINAHHCSKTFSQILEEYKIKTIEEALACKELWNINNGLTLCRFCHQTYTFKKR